MEQLNQTNNSRPHHRKYIPES